MTSTLINGEVKSVLSCQDRGLQYGDGLFETFAVLQGKISHWALHWQRFSAGCERLFIPLPDEAQIKKEMNTLIKPLDKQVIKLTYTRGESRRGYVFDQAQVQPTRIISQSPWPDFNANHTTQGIELYQCATRLAHQPLLAGLKHLNRLENVLARHEWQDKKFSEGLMCDISGFVIEGTMSNIFMVKNKILHTPDLKNCGVSGITRQRIINAVDRKKINIRDISMDNLLMADEVFVCNSLIGIWPVKKLGRAHFSIEKNANPVTRFLQHKINTSHESHV